MRTLEEIRETQCSVGAPDGMLWSPEKSNLAIEQLVMRDVPEMLDALAEKDTEITRLGECLEDNALSLAASAARLEFALGKVANRDVTIEELRAETEDAEWRVGVWAEMALASK